jgi:replicative DNA helicase
MKQAPQKQWQKPNTKPPAAPNIPYDGELEAVVLGAALIEKLGLDALIAEINTPDVFYVPAHQMIYSAIKQLVDDNKPLDIMTVTTVLRANGNLKKVGGAAGVSDLTQRVSSGANNQYYCKLLIELYVRRMVIHSASEVLGGAYAGYDDTLVGMDAAEQTFSQLRSTFSKGVASIEKVGARVMEKYDRAKELGKLLKAGEFIITGVPSNVNQLNEKTAGWQGGDLVIIAGRPGMGKTSFAMCEALHAAMQGYGVGVFSLEMSDDSLVTRLAATHGNINYKGIRKGWADREKVQAALNAVGRLPLYIDECVGLSLHELKARARNMVRNNGVKMIVVDYLQLMELDVAERRDIAIGNITKGLKQLAKELNVPILLLCQLSRAVETRGGVKVPMLSDLKDSGAIEQDADIVMFTYRPEYYKITEFEGGGSTHNKAVLILAKYREDETGDVVTGFVGSTFAFGDMFNKDAF